MKKRTLLTALFAAIAAVAAAPASAQYDRDGRYVPSPMGVPSDPNARVVPMYPGSPGGAVGSPTWPRDPDQRLAPMRPRTGTDDPRILWNRTVPLNKKRCAEGWSKKLGITAAEFEIRCAKINRIDQ